MYFAQIVIAWNIIKFRLFTNRFRTRWQVRNPGKQLSKMPMEGFEAAVVVGLFLKETLRVLGVGTGSIRPSNAYTARVRSVG